MIYTTTQGPRSLFKSEGGGGRQDSTGVIPRGQFGFYPVIIYYPPKKVEGPWLPRPSLFPGPCYNFLSVVSQEINN